MEVTGRSAESLEILARVSQAENMKLAEIARRYVETGQLPSVSGPETAGAMR
jgi:hypothetical protein